MVTLASGAALTIPLSGTILTACSKVEKVEESSYVLQFFSEEEYAEVKKLLNLILPKTNSPSAVDVGVQQVMDHMVGKVYGEDERKSFAMGFEALQQYMSSGLSETRVKELLVSEQDSDQLAKMSLIGFKQQAVTYYLSSKEIATEYLNFLPIPGIYEPCISLESVDGKAWAI